MLGTDMDSVGGCDAEETGFKVEEECQQVLAVRRTARMLRGSVGVSLHPWPLPPPLFILVAGLLVADRLVSGPPSPGACESSPNNLIFPDAGTQVELDTVHTKGQAADQLYTAVLRLAFSGEFRPSPES